MGKLSRPGRVVTLRTLLNVNQHANKHFLLKRYLVGVALIAASLACSLSPRTAEAPYFTPPGGENVPTNTPDPALLPVEFDPATATPTVLVEDSSPALITPIAEPTVTPTDTPPAIN